MSAGDMQSFPTKSGRLGTKQIFRACRPDVLLVLKHAEIMQWGWLVELVGTAQELMAVGVATQDMLSGLGKSGRKTDYTPLGDKYVVRARKGERFELELWLRDDPAGGEPSDPKAQATVWWRQHGAAVDAEVAAALARMRREVPKH